MISSDRPERTSWGGADRDHSPGSVVGLASLVEGLGAQLEEPPLKATRHLLEGLVVRISQTWRREKENGWGERGRLCDREGGEVEVPRMVNLRRASRSCGWVLRTRKRQKDRALSGGSPSPVDDNTNTAISNSDSANCSTIRQSKKSTGLSKIAIKGGIYA